MPSALAHDSKVWLAKITVLLLFNREYFAVAMPAGW